MTIPTLHPLLLSYHFWGMLFCISTFTRREIKEESRHLREPGQEWNSWEESDSPPVWPFWLLFHFCHVAWRHSRHRAIQPCPVNLVIPRRAHAVPGVVLLGGAREVLSQEIPGRAEAAQQEGVLRALVKSRLARRSTEWFGWKVLDSLCPAETTRSLSWALQRSSWVYFSDMPSLLPLQSLAVVWSFARPNYVISFGELAATRYELDWTVYVPVPLPRYFTTKQSAYFCESLSPFLSSEPLFIQEHILNFFILMNVRYMYRRRKRMAL